MLFLIVLFLTVSIVSAGEPAFEPFSEFIPSFEDIIDYEEDFKGYTNELTFGWSLDSLTGETYFENFRGENLWQFSSNPINRDVFAPIKKPFALFDADHQSLSTGMYYQAILKSPELSTVCETRGGTFIRFDAFFSPAGHDSIGTVQLHSYDTAGNSKVVETLLTFPENSPFAQYEVDISDILDGDFAEKSFSLWFVFSGATGYWMIDNVEVICRTTEKCQGKCRFDCMNNICACNSELQSQFFDCEIPTLSSTVLANSLEPCVFTTSLASLSSLACTVNGQPFTEGSNTILRVDGDVGDVLEVFVDFGKLATPSSHKFVARRVRNGDVNSYVITVPAGFDPFREGGPEQTYVYVANNGLFFTKIDFELSEV